MSSDSIISVEALSKSYFVGHQSERRERYTALRDVLVRNAKNIARKTMEMARGRQIIQGDTVEEFWALKDVSFEVKQGEALGIIGRNGAGKSTLLKILSRITEPTKGRVILRGRVASLLEVGTGFHPELTGRENIFLNGAILGMKRAEIKRKFDEIVTFAEVEKFLDTPVKRYSSGMYVRLAFAVAAHLEPEILIVDEVLAVGDIAFQKKCLGKMQQVSASQGRTVLFVSHNMQAINQLCNRAILIESGSKASEGDPNDITNMYLQAGQAGGTLQKIQEQIASIPPDPAFILKNIDVQQEGVSTTELITGKPALIKIEYDVLQDSIGLHVYILLYDMDGTLLLESLHNGDSPDLPFMAKGHYISTVKIPEEFLAGKSYTLQVQAAIHCARSFFPSPPSFTINVHYKGKVNRAYLNYTTPGRLAPLLEWVTLRL